MEAKHTRRRWTYSEFARLPGDGGVRNEIIDGRLAVTPAPAVRHQRIVTRLVAALYPMADSGRGEVLAGPVDVLLAEGDYLEPDVVFVRKERAGILSERGVEGPPDLVVEVVSPSTAARDRGVKLQRYRHYGVAEYWIVDADAACIERWRFDPSDSREVLGVGDELTWHPGDGGNVLVIDVGSILGPETSAAD